MILNAKVYYICSSYHEYHYTHLTNNQKKVYSGFLLLLIKAAN